MNDERKIAYFSMEIALDTKVPTYSGGLGVLAGDTIRSAADLKLPLVAVTLLYRKGYFNQRLDASGWQREELYRDRDHFIEIMLHCIALNGSFFNTQRMLQQYVLKAYF